MKKALCLTLALVMIFALAVSGMAAVAAACKAERFIRQTKVYHSSSSGGGGGGRGGGGGGGGHSGGGGGHRF